MQGLFRELREFPVLKQLKSLFQTWWNLEFIFLRCSETDLVFDNKLQNQNSLVAKLLQAQLFQRDLLDSFQACNPSLNSKKEDFTWLIWKKTGLEILAMPLFLQKKLEGFVLITGFQTKNNPQLKKALSYIDLDSEEIEAYLKTCQIFKKKDIVYVAKLFAMLFKEACLVFEERKRYLSSGRNAEYLPEETKSLTGISPSVKFLRKFVEKIEKSEDSVLVFGAKGSGKSHLCRVIHNRSSRKDQGFFIQDCSSISKSALEIRLFGKEACSSSEAEIGLLEQANRGSLLLKNIEHLPKTTQTQVLRVLKEGVFFPVGARRSKKTDVRFFASSKKEDPRILLNQNLLKSSLFYELNTFGIKTPCLKERVEDIPALVESFLRKGSAQSYPQQMSEKVMELFYNYSWPGNISELEGEVKKLVHLSPNEDSIITERYVSKNIKKETPDKSLERFLGRPLKETLGILEKEILTEQLKREGGNKSRVAKILGLSRTSIIGKTKEHNIDEPESA